MEIGDIPNYSDKFKVGRGRWIKNIYERRQNKHHKIIDIRFLEMLILRNFQMRMIFFKEGELDSWKIESHKEEAKEKLFYSASEAFTVNSMMNR